MREFTSSPFGGTDRGVTTTLLGKIARNVQRVGFTVPGSAGSGFRGNSFSADQPQVNRVIQHLEVLRIKEEDFRTFSSRTVGNEDGSEAVDNTVYQGRIVRYESTDTTVKNQPIYKAKSRAWSTDDILYDIHTNLWFNQFLLSAGTLDEPDTDSEDIETHQWGDVVACSYDYLSGAFVLLSPIVFRAGIADEVIVRGSFGKVQIQQHTGDTKQEFTSAKVLLADARTDWIEQSVFKGDRVTLAYLDETWQILIAENNARFIHFTLTSNLTFSTQTTQDFTVDLFYGGSNPDDSTVAFSIRNPDAGCTGELFRFEGSTGCRGQAIYDERRGVYQIWQMDCDPEPPSLDSSSSSSPSSSSLSSSSSSTSQNSSSTS